MGMLEGGLDRAKPARKQVDEPVTAHEEKRAPGTFNVWTGRTLKEYRTPRENTGPRQASKYRCLPKADTGWTRGADSGATFACYYFARGLCHHGADCNYLHRLPTEADERRHRTDYGNDIFGRERVPEARDSRKKGVGSYERECRTLYVHYGGAGTLPAAQVRQLLDENFKEWGPIEDVYVVPSKTIGFIRYHWRSAAEFAKAAMHQQTLLGSDTTEVLDVRWANDDPNPRAMARVHREREEAMRDAYFEAVNELPPEAKRARLQQLQMMSTVHKGIASAEYPNTNDQFGDGTGRVANPYRHEYQGWDVYQQQQQQRGNAEGEEQALEAARAGGSGAAVDPTEQEREQWAAFQAWQAWQQQAHAHPSSSMGDDYTRYLRPGDAVAAAGAAAAAAVKQQQQQLNPERALAAAQPDEEQAAAAAQEALGLIGGYGSGSESEA